MGENNSLNVFSRGDKDLVLFDGVCNLCNGAVRFILKRDTEEKFLFASLQSDLAGRVLESLQYRTDVLSSIVVVSQSSRVMTKSDAVLYIAGHLPGAWKLLYILRIIPRFIRNGVYDLVARYRYKFFGRQDQCPWPTPAVRQRFLDTK